MGTIYNEEYKRLASQQIVVVARQILSGELGLVAGARRLSCLRFDVDAKHDPDFAFFVGVDSETDHLPLEEVRSRWSSDALKVKDEELQRYETTVRGRALEVCQHLIGKYETHDT